MTLIFPLILVESSISGRENLMKRHSSFKGGFLPMGDILVLKQVQKKIGGTTKGIAIATKGINNTMQLSYQIDTFGTDTFCCRFLL